VSSYLQASLASPAIFAGIGLHSGSWVRVVIRPAPINTGIVFVRTDLASGDNRVPVSAEAVCQTRLGTVIDNASGVRVSTIEHLMAALAALSIDNAVIEVDGPEVPIMDGSSIAFVQVLDQAGRRTQASARQVIEILSPIEVTEPGGKFARLLPCDRFEVAFEIEFPTAAIGRQSVDIVADEQGFRRELADCRTFGFLQDVEALRAVGLARGGSMENAIVIEGDRILNPEGLRRPDEFVRHKALDAIGDLYVLGSPILGRFEGVKAGHGLNNALARAVMATPSAWRLRTLLPELAEAG
jgi:UDP-3-O-[3-hydroxymyristoyl] N-acetylglucosamine deacetylase